MNQFELLADYFRRMDLCITATAEPLTARTDTKRILIFSNVAYAIEQKICTKNTDILVFLNKANCAEYYRNDKVESIQVWRRKDETAFGFPLPFAENHIAVNDIPQKFWDELSKKYDWKYECWDGRHGDMTTGYVVVKYIHHLYPEREIVLVNFGNEVAHSTRRTPNHNWNFENRDLAQFKHLYTGAKMDTSKVFKLYYEQYGWLGDNIYASAVLRNLVNTGKFAVNVNPEKHPEIWENCPFLDRSITKANADFVCRQRYRGMWRIGCKHIIEGTTRTITGDTGIEIPITSMKPEIWMDLPKERLVDGDYVLINTGWQNSAEPKKWNREYWRALITLNPEVKFVQIGQAKNHAEPIEGVENWIDKTTTQQLAQLVRDASCVISPPSGVIHIAGAFDVPFVSIAGGREPESYGTYPCGITLSTCGKLSCCRRGGCRKKSFNGDKPCIYPEYSESEKIATGRCMNMITAQMVSDAVDLLKRTPPKLRYRSF